MNNAKNIPNVDVDSNDQNAPKPRARLRTGVQAGSFISWLWGRIPKGDYDYGSTAVTGVRG